MTKPHMDNSATNYGGLFCLEKSCEDDVKFDFTKPRVPKEALIVWVPSAQRDSYDK